MKVNILKNDTEHKVAVTLDLNTSAGCMRTIVLLDFILKEKLAFPFDEEARTAIQNTYTEAIRTYPILIQPD